MSLMPGQRERHELLGSELSSDPMRSSVCEPLGHKTDRFTRYISNTQNEKISEETCNLLHDMFGDDATTNK